MKSLSSDRSDPKAVSVGAVIVQIKANDSTVNTSIDFSFTGLSSDWIPQETITGSAGKLVYTASGFISLSSDGGIEYEIIRNNNI